MTRFHEVNIFDQFMVKIHFFQSLKKILRSYEVQMMNMVILNILLLLHIIVIAEYVKNTKYN